MKLEAIGVSIRYPRSPFTLDNVSLRLEPGQLVAVVGPNGSGKTTLLRALLGLVAPDHGRVELDGRGIATRSRRELAEAIGALPQREEPAFPLTVREAVLMGRWARLGPVAPVTAADEQAVDSALARCDVSGFDERGIDTLSGGEWQRVRLARALAATPRLLLLDEPTAALDVGHAMELFELLRTLAADGLGVLVITHELNIAARFADRVALLDRGRMVANGTPADVLRADIVANAFAWPVAVTPWRDGSPQVTPLRRNES